jgi:hypothetical protein
MTTAEWAELLGLKPSTISGRLNRLGWTTERALITGASSEALARLAAPESSN